MQPTISRKDKRLNDEIFKLEGEIGVYEINEIYNNNKRGFCETGSFLTLCRDIFYCRSYFSKLWK